MLKRIMYFFIDEFNEYTPYFDDEFYEDEFVEIIEDELDDMSYYH